VNKLKKGNHMTKLRKMMFGFLFTITMLTAPQMVAANELAGPWIAVNASINGVELDGQHKDGMLEPTNASIGAIAPIFGFEVGYSVPMGARFALGIGVEWTSGEASFDGDAGGGDAQANNGDVEITFGDHMTGYLMPQIMIGDDSSLFVKLGVTHVSVAATGDIDGGSVPSSLGGATLAFGTRSLFGNGAFIQFEGGIREYDEFSAFGGGANTNGHVKADPLVAYGGVSLGVKF
jgi:hypothetical protein